MKTNTMTKVKSLSNFKNSVAGLFILALASGAFAQNLDSLNCSEVGRLTYNQTLSDVWGWVDTANGDEYALVGLRNGFSVVDVSNPSQPVELRSFPGASSVWRDIKTYGPYAYVIHDQFTGNSDGILIVDLRTIRQQNPTVFRRYPVVTIDSVDYNYNRSHNLFIDENGIMYIFGANAGVGGVLAFDLKPDPTNPTLLGNFNDFYVHDGVARGDTLWAAAVLQGYFGVINANSKSNMQLMATKTTPSNFTHNLWFSDDNQRVFTTDERTGAFIGEYDVSDLNGIVELDRLRTSFGTNVIPHNTHFHNNFLVTSYYTAGLQIVDVSQDGIMVEVGYFDTSPSVGDGFNGAWGAYPYLPSGNILVTDIQTGLWVISCTYDRASFVNAHIVDSISRANIFNASVRVLGTNITGRSNLFGNYREGFTDTGVVQLAVSRTGYRSDTFSLRLIPGQLLNRQFALAPEGLSTREQQLSNLSLYPNPARGSSKLAGLPIQGKGSLRYRLFDYSGRSLQSGVIDVNGSPEARIDWQVPAGSYRLELGWGDWRRSFPLLIRP